MKQTAVEWLIEKILSIPLEEATNVAHLKEYVNKLEVFEQAKEMEDKNLLEMLHKFGFDYTYNYRGEKTIYEWIPEWFEEYKRLCKTI